MTTKKIMISYGHADSTDFAEKIKEVLVTEGYSVWIDRSLETNNGINAGSSWEESIEEVIQTHDIVIAILSPHAIKRSEGICLDSFTNSGLNIMFT